MSPSNSICRARLAGRIERALHDLPIASQVEPFCRDLLPIQGADLFDLDHPSAGSRIAVWRDLDAQVMGLGQAGPRGREERKTYPGQQQAERQSARSSLCGKGPQDAGPGNGRTEMRSARKKRAGARSQDQFAVTKRIHMNWLGSRTPPR